MDEMVHHFSKNKMFIRLEARVAKEIFVKNPALVSLLVGFSAPAAAVALAFGEYSRLWLPHLSPQLIGSLLLITFAGIHAIHVQRGAWIQNLAVLAKLLLIVILVACAAGNIHPPPLGGSSKFSLSSFAVSLVFVSFSYSGWNAAVYIGSGIRDPERKLPRGIAIGVRS